MTSRNLKNHKIMQIYVICIYNICIVQIYMICILQIYVLCITYFWLRIYMRGFRSTVHIMTIGRRVKMCKVDRNDP
jgi:hypothetical protein